MTVCAFVTVLLLGCTDDLRAPEAGGDFQRGLPVRATIKLNVSNRLTITRADMDEGRERQIRSLWVGFFCADEGDNQGRLMFQETYGAQAVGRPLDFISDPQKLTIVSDIVTGNYYIAAVANAVGNYGVMAPRADGTGAVTDDTELIGLLRTQVLTIADYRRLAHTRGTRDVGDTGTPLGNLVMQGVFLPAGFDYEAGLPEMDSWIDNPVSIIRDEDSPEDVTLAGAIHFKRLVSQIKFNVSFEENVSNVEVTSVSIVNVPTASWIAERKETADDLNACDDPNLLGLSTDAVPGRTAAFRNYPAGVTLYAKDMVTEAADNSFSFDWYQMENRRTGHGICRTYADREREHKYTEADRSDDGLSLDGRNTGVYTALSESATDVHQDNNATYVQIGVKMRVEHPEDLTAEQLDAIGLPEGSSSPATVEALYTVHLGYCEGEDEEKARDFNCRRNSRYIYNLKIKGINKIILEALRDDNGELQPGAEGIVNFSDGELIDADAHYQVYNIRLTDSERESGKWQIRVYRSESVYYDITPETYARYPEKFWNWIEFRPAESEDALMPYVPYGTDCAWPLFRLGDLTDLVNHPGRGADDGEGKWYTMYVNEYVYEDEGWRQYVNLPPRTLWLGCIENLSTDAESQVFNSRYVVRQRSIQTFYNSGDVTVGLEHVNELKKTPIYQCEEKPLAVSGTHDDCRWLNWQALDIVDNKGHGGYRWDGHLQESRALRADGSLTATGNTDYASRGVVRPLDTGGFNGAHNTGLANHRFNESVYSTRACLNRNRDLNGNGVIDPEELRWIVPTAKVYLSFINAKKVLPSPLMDLSGQTPGSQIKITVDGEIHDVGETDYYYKSLMHYCTIEKDQVWAEEGLSTGWLSGCPKPQDVRCVRYLGNYPVTPSQTDPITLPQTAQTLDDGRIIMHFDFVPEAYRPASFGASLEWHRIYSEFNAPSNSRYMEVSPDSRKINVRSYLGLWPMTKDRWETVLAEGDPCENHPDFGLGWRVPNQVEMEAIRTTLGDLEHNDYGYYLTCSQEHFAPSRIMGTIHIRSLAISDHDFSTASQVYIRCVRDLHPSQAE